jgi:CheY-like chemotaxis protein
VDTPLAGRVVIVVDDSQDTVEVVCMALRLAGAQTVGLSSATAALSLIEATPPDAVVTDLSMPEMDGCELIGAMRHCPAAADIPAVVITAFASPESRERCHQAGAQAVLTKPLDTDVLARTLAGLIARSDARQRDKWSPSSR